MILTILRSIGQIFCKMPLNWDLPYIFSYDWARFVDFVRKTTEVECHFYHIMSREHNINMTSLYWCWYWSPGWAFFQVIPRKFYSPSPTSSPYYTLWKKVAMPNPYLKTEELCPPSLSVEYLHTLFENLLMGDFSVLICF